MLEYIVWSEWWNSKERQIGMSFDDYIPVYFAELGIKATYKEGMKPMKVYKVDFDGDWCAFDCLDEAIKMFLDEIEEQVSDEEYEKVKCYLKELDESIDINYEHKKTLLSLYSDTITEKEFDNIPEFEGFC